ncbi:hypothetical protein BLOT_014094 [Blomia tropicalis]|nr:hypothetical protein BLOT_014094 [Blomia tropicalis]
MKVVAKAAILMLSEKNQNNLFIDHKGDQKFFLNAEEKQKRDFLRLREYHFITLHTKIYTLKSEVGSFVSPLNMTPPMAWIEFQSTIIKKS